MLQQFVILLFLFFIGSMAGWCIELVFRRFFGANNPEHRWINPGFLTGPCLPLYGFGLTALYLLADIPVPIEHIFLQKLILFLLMAVAMTLIEYVAGVIFIKGLHVRLWDYTMRRGNIQGIICPLFSFFWMLLGAAYDLFVHPHILNALAWLMANMAFCLVIGFFYGILAVDLVYSFELVTKIKRFAEEKDVIIRYEALKTSIRRAGEEQKEKLHFLFAFRSEVPLRAHFERYMELMTAFYGDRLPEPIKKRVSRKRRERDEEDALDRG